MPAQDKTEVPRPEQAPPDKATRGALSWMARNTVAANLLMLVALLGGLFAARGAKQEVFPEFEVDQVFVTVPFPGASPTDTEQGIVLSIEEAIRSVDGVKRVRSVASEGAGQVNAELLLGTDPDEVAAEIKSAVDRIQTFPEQAERPVVSVVSTRREVVSIFFSGDVAEDALHELAERARADLLALPEITQVEVQGVRPLEVSVEVPRETLEAYGLGLQEIAAQIRAASVEVPSGGLETSGGELLVRVDDRRRRGAEFADIVVKSATGGQQVRLGDIATIRDGYEELDRSNSFNGKPLVWVTAYRVGDETPTSVSRATRDYADRIRGELPEGVEVTIWNDDSELLASRIDLLRRNAISGLVLVLLTLALFLRRRLAAWVALGIPVSFLGAFIFMNALGVSINMISLFALIVTLGMVVDDAIIVAEAIHTKRQEGMTPLRAAIEGARQMAVPVSFSILTTVAAFAPLLVIPGMMGKFLSIIPLVVISVLAVSLLESFFILPAHLAHEGRPGRLGAMFWRPLDRMQGWVDRKLKRFIAEVYQPLLRVVLHYRYAVVAAGLASLVVCGAMVKSGVVPYRFFPKVEADVVAASARLPYGTPLARTEQVAGAVEAAAERALAALGGNRVRRGIFRQVGTGAPTAGGPGGGPGKAGSHLATLWVQLVPSAERSFSSEQFAQRWRNELPPLSGVESLTVGSFGGPGAGKPVDVQLSHRSTEVLAQASEALANELRGYDSLTDVANSFAGGNPQLSFTLREEARALGLTSRDVALAMRSALFGAEALREQRGRNEVKVRVKLPKYQRASEYDLEELTLPTPAGGFVPLPYVADFSRGYSATEITREDGKRTVNVSADLRLGAPSPGPVLASLQAEVLPRLKVRFPGLETSFVGQQREQQESFKSLGPNFLFALLVIYALIAIPFKSYVQPIIVMSAIPFGILGAVLGHLALGYELSFISALGIIALSGVVVNDSLVLVDGINRFRRQGKAADDEEPRPLSAFDAVVMGGMRRFRPILLTSLTTFFGLLPMIFETSMQARFLIPMAISLGFGALFVTVIALLLVPSLYLVVEDAIGRPARKGDPLPAQPELSRS